MGRVQAAAGRCRWAHVDTRPAGAGHGARARAVTALAIFLTTAGAGSALAAHRRASGDEAQAQAECSISLLPSAPAVRVGEAAGLTGSLSCTGTTPVAQQSVTIEQHVAGTPGLALAGTATTGPGGEFSFTTSSGLERVSSFRAEATGPQPSRARDRVGSRGDAHRAGRGGIAASPRHPPRAFRRDGRGADLPGDRDAGHARRPRGPAAPEPARPPGVAPDRPRDGAGGRELHAAARVLGRRYRRRCAWWCAAGAYGRRSPKRSRT